MSERDSMMAGGDGYEDDDALRGIDGSPISMQSQRYADVQNVVDKFLRIEGQEESAWISAAMPEEHAKQVVRHRMLREWVVFGRIHEEEALGSLFALMAGVDGLRVRTAERVATGTQQQQAGADAARGILSLLRGGGPNEADPKVKG